MRVIPGRPVELCLEQIGKGLVWCNWTLSNSRRAVLSLRVFLQEPVPVYGQALVGDGIVHSDLNVVRRKVRDVPLDGLKSITYLPS